MCYKALEAAGLLCTGKGKLSVLEPLPHDPERPSLSAILVEMRDEEDR